MLDRLLPVLGDAPHVYVAVGSTSGPHVTPELFTTSGGRIVCLTAATTLKAKLVPSSPVVAFAARTSRSSLTGIGTATVVDPTSPSSVARGATISATSPLGVARFVRDNAAELAGAAADLVAGRLGDPLPPHRVLLAITPTAFARVDDGVLAELDGWSAPTTAPAGEARPTTIDLRQVPDHLADLAGGADAVVGWTRADGSPLALPATWTLETGTATVPTALFEACGAAPTSPAAVTLDTWSGLGPSGKQGLMLRGAGRATSDGDTTSLTVTVERVTHWDGITTATTS